MGEGEPRQGGGGETNCPDKRGYQAVAPVTTDPSGHGDILSCHPGNSGVEAGRWKGTARTTTALQD